MNTGNSYFNRFLESLSNCKSGITAYKFVKIQSRKSDEADFRF